MKSTKLCMTLSLAPLCVAALAGPVGQSRPRVMLQDGKVTVAMDFTLDSLKLGSNKQIFMTPVIEDNAGNRTVLPSLLVNGRNMHYSYERGSIRRGGDRNYDVLKEVRRYNGKPQTVDYAASADYDVWMMSPDARVTVISDSCGCGHEVGQRIHSFNLDLNPAPRMHLAYLTPEVTALPVAVHEGRARVQFEVDRTELHPDVYICRNGQRIDNRQQLAVIDDSVRYALSDPNVEIASISICGYASPESPYLHNEELSTGRSRALAEYLAERYNLPREKSTYSSVPENWKEFRELVVASDRLSDTQRADLLDLIDAPAYGPSDYDAKERLLKTDRRYAEMYRKFILPEWFPLLRATEFAISTQLRPLSDEQLAEVIRKTPALMSLNQMMRVARLYPEGSDEFNEIIAIAREYYPDDATSALNAAIAEISKGDYDKAEELLAHAGESPEALNARGVVAVNKGDFDLAKQLFTKALILPEAAANLRMLDPRSNTDSNSDSN